MGAAPRVPPPHHMSPLISPGRRWGERGVPYNLALLLGFAVVKPTHGALTTAQLEVSELGGAEKLHHMGASHPRQHST